LENISRKLGIKFGQYASIYHRESTESMFKKILEKLKFGSCKVTSENVKDLKKSEKKEN
jgi:hypothetical protein